MSTDNLPRFTPSDLRTRTTLVSLRAAAEDSGKEFLESLAHSVNTPLSVIGDIALLLGNGGTYASEVAHAVNAGSRLSYSETQGVLRENEFRAGIGAYASLDWVIRGFSNAYDNSKRAIGGNGHDSRAAHAHVWQHMQGLAYPLADARTQLSAAGLTERDVPERLLRLSQYLGHAADLFSVTSYNPETGQVTVNAPGINEEGWHQGHFSAGQREGAKVIVIAEDPAFVAALRRSYQSRGYEDVYATTCQEDGIKVLADSTPEEVLAELDMAGTGGLEFATRVRRTHSDKATFMAPSPLPPGYIDHVVETLGARLHPTDEFAEEKLAH